MLESTVLHILKRVLLWAPILGIGLFVASSCGNSDDDITAFQEKQILPQLISTQIVIEYSDSARLKARVKAPLLEEFGPPENLTVMRKGVDVFFYDAGGNVTSTMHADSALMRRNSDLMEAYQNVKVTNENGEQLLTDRLFWRNAQNQADRQLYSDAFVTIKKGDETLYGDGLTANESFTKYKITKPHGSFYMENDPNAPKTP